MGNVKEKIFVVINHVGQAIPKRFQRKIADNQIVLKIFQRLSKNSTLQIATPEGNRLVVNSLFHSNLINSDSLHNYEPDIRNAILKLTKKGMVAYDIGANVGIFSFLFSSIVGRDGTVYAFEPEENNYRCFELSLGENRAKNITLDKRAVGNVKSTGRFDRRGGAFSGRLVGTGSYETTKNIQVVETVSIDYLVEEEGYQVPDILKIDVEGNEGMVLEGMKNTLGEYSPVIVCELHSHLGESPELVTNLLHSYGYKIFNIKDVINKKDLDTAATVVPTGGHIVALK